MWTHRTPYVPSDLTEESIERHGRIALNRALHLDRVIAFVGSGVSAAYGGPAWTDFAGFMVAVVREATGKRDFPSGLQAIRDHLAKIVGGDARDPLRPPPSFAKEIGDQLTTLLALCEDALRLVDAYPAGSTGAGGSYDGSIDVDERSDLPLVVQLKKQTATVGLPSEDASRTHRQRARSQLAAEIVADGAQDAARRLLNLLGRRPHGYRLENAWENLGEGVKQLAKVVGGVDGDSASRRKAGTAPVFVDPLKLYAALLDDPRRAAPLVQAIMPELPRTGGAAAGADVIESILDLGIGRFATLNYDVTLERRILALKGAIGEPVDKSFRDLLWPTPNLTRKAVKPDIASGGKGSGTVRSTILKASTAGELFNFALRDSVAGCHVVHIHGRYDDPDNILLTEEDYRRQYIASGESAGALGETMRVMFSGNDVLFIGVGLKEDDVLGPLRSVLTRDRSPDADARQTIALLPATVPKLSEDGGSDEKAIGDAARRDALFAVHQKLKYGINVLRYGRDDRGYQRLTGFILALENGYESFRSKKPNYSVNSRFKLQRKTCIFLGNNFRIWMRLPRSEVSHSRSGSEKIPQPGTAAWYSTKLDNLLSQCEDDADRINNRNTILSCEEQGILHKLCKNFDEYGADMRRQAAIEILKILRGRIQARTLVAELARIKADKDKWWKDWRCLPRERRPRFHERPPEKCADPNDTYPVWVRHCPELVTPLDKFDAEGQGAFERAVTLGHLEAVRDQPRQRSRSRILRLAVPRGGGKGALLRILFEPRAHRRVFERTTYDGAFFAHMSFSMEFSSILGALSRFIAGRIAARTIDRPFWYPDGRKPAKIDARRQHLVANWEKWPERALGSPSAKQIADWSEETTTPRHRTPYGRPLPLTRLELLRALLDRYDEITRDPDSKEPLSDARLFICLGGLDRLCNEHGDAYNPLHRAFFRLLTGSGETLPGGGPGDPPLDIVLVASRRDVPIAYLSREGRPDKLQPQDRYVYALTSATTRHLRKWDELPRLNWKARLRLTPDRIGNEPGADDPRSILIEELDRTPEKYDPCMPARREFWESIALSGWGISNVVAFVEFRLKSTPRSGPEPLVKRSLVREWLHRMSSAADRGRFAGVLSEILLCYREIDSADTTTGDGRHGIGLRDRILETLALLAVPVELAVLYGCPGIRSLLPNGEGHRQQRYDMLKSAVRKLVDRGLLIEVRPGGKAGALAHERGTIQGDYERHVRYVVHDQLRELIANRMRLFVPDGKDRNHFQVSIYCEQPRDTPTPSMERFRQVRDILRMQIGRSRDTLGALYVLDQFSGYSKQQERGRQQESGQASEVPSPDGERPLTERHVERITHALGTIENICFRGEAPGLFDHHIHLHAVPQRLRACYALLRGSFSISALSRLSGEEIDPVGDRPFDEYRSWLRGLINAAIGLYEVEALTRAIVEEPSKGTDPTVLKIVDDLSKNISDMTKRKSSTESFNRKLVTLNREVNRLKGRRAELQTSAVGSVKHPYYVDEIAWLLNERGLVSFVQGRIYDALADFERALAWVASDPKGAEDPAYRALERRIRLNRAITMIDAGQIARARSGLLEIRSDVTPFPGGSPSAMHLHARGYLALCDHLTGNLEQARSGYEAVVRECNEAGNLRAAALYNAHFGDLLARLGKREEAQEKIYLARSAAAQSEQRDILHLVILRHAQQLLTVGNAKGAIERTAQAEAYGDALGLHKIRAEAMLVRAEGLLLQGDARSAGAVAAEGVAICHRHGLRLRRIATSILYGETLFARGEKALAIPVLLEAKREAERIGYHLKAARAQRILSSFEFATPTPPPADYAGSQTGIAW